MATEPQLGRAARAWCAEGDSRFLAALAYMGKCPPPGADLWADARCRTVDPDIMFTGTAGRSGKNSTAHRVSRTVCGPCKVQAQCLAGALDRSDEYGVYGATTREVRRKMHIAWRRIRKQRTAKAREV